MHYRPACRTRLRPRLHQVTGQLRHARGGRSGARGEGEDVEKREPAIVDERAGVLKHRVGLGREAGDEVGAEDDVGAKPPDLVAEADGVGAAVPALHALQDHVVARLQREMQMRHQPLLLGDGAHQLRVGLDGIDRGEAEARKLRHVLQDLPHERPRRGRPGRSAP